jgi:hypothetical protein
MWLVWCRGRVGAGVIARLDTKTVATSCVSNWNWKLKADIGSSGKTNGTIGGWIDLLDKKIVAWPGDAMDGWLMSWSSVLRVAGGGGWRRTCAPAGAVAWEFFLAGESLESRDSRDGRARVDKTRERTATLHAPSTTTTIFYLQSLQSTRFPLPETRDNIYF